MESIIELSLLAAPMARWLFAGKQRPQSLVVVLCALRAVCPAGNEAADPGAQEGDVRLLSNLLENFGQSRMHPALARAYLAAPSAMEPALQCWQPWQPRPGVAGASATSSTLAAHTGVMAFWYNCLRLNDSDWPNVFLGPGRPGRDDAEIAVCGCCCICGGAGLVG